MVLHGPNHILWTNWPCDQQFWLVYISSVTWNYNTYSIESNNRLNDDYGYWKEWKTWGFSFPLEELKSVLEDKMWLQDSHLYSAEELRIRSTARLVLQQFGHSVDTGKFVMATRRHIFIWVWGRTSSLIVLSHRTARIEHVGTTAVLVYENYINQTLKAIWEGHYRGGSDDPLLY